MINHYKNNKHQRKSSIKCQKNINNMVKNYMQQQQMILIIFIKIKLEKQIKLFNNIEILMALLN